MTSYEAAMAERRSSTPQQAGRIKDARGRNVTQLDPIAMNLLRQHGVIPADTLRGITDEIGSGLPKNARAVLYIFVAVLIFETVVFFIRVGELTLSGRFLDIFDKHSVLLLSGWPWALVFWLMAKRRRWGRIRRAMLKHLRCPHCGYDLRLLPADPADGATVCPECGCAWKLDNSEAAQQEGSDDRE
jgi:hypothetical protein